LALANPPGKQTGRESCRQRGIEIHTAANEAPTPAHRSSNHRRGLRICYIA
jgi:hypothetical protein